MGIADKLRNLGKKAEEAAVEHQDQIHEAVLKAEAAADSARAGSITTRL